MQIFPRRCRYLVPVCSSPRLGKTMDLSQTAGDIQNWFCHLLGLSVILSILPNLMTGTWCLSDIWPRPRYWPQRPIQTRWPAAAAVSRRLFSRKLFKQNKVLPIICIIVSHCINATTRPISAGTKRRGAPHLRSSGSWEALWNIKQQTIEKGSKIKQSKYFSAIS